MGEKTEAQKRAQKTYMEKFVRVEIRMSQEKREQLQTHAERTKESVNGFINRAIDEAMERDRLEAGALETKELLSMPGISKKLVDGKNTSLSECVSESEAGW